MCDLSDCLEALAAEKSPRERSPDAAARHAVLSATESVAQQFETLLLPHLSVVTGHLLPRICLLLSSSARDLRMWAVSMLRQILPATTKALTLHDGALSAIVRERLLPLCPTLLGDHDPISPGQPARRARSGRSLASVPRARRSRVRRRARDPGDGEGPRGASAREEGSFCGL